MASTYENDLRLEEMATGENSGSWGTKTNTNLELIADAFSYGTETIANADTTITIADGAADAARSLALKINSSADLTTTRTITLAPNTTSKVWIIENNTSGGQTLTISAGSGSNVTLLNGQTKIIATDGIGAGSNVVELTQDIAIADLFIDDDLSMQSDSAIINFGADADITLTHAADTSLTLGGAGSTTGLIVNNTATDGDPFLAFALSGTQTFTMGVDDGDSDKFKIGTTAIGTNTSLTIDSTGDVEINQGNFTVTSIGTGAAAGPYFNLSRNSSSPADDDAIGIIQFNGKNDQDESLAYVQIQTNILDATDATEDGYFRVNVRANGSLEDSLTISNNNIIFNDSSLDRDFRVESDSNANMLFVDAGSNHVNIGTSDDLGGLLNLNSGDGSFIVMRGASNNTGYINWESNGFTFFTNGPVEALRIGSSETVVNEDGRDYDFRVESDTNTHALFLDAANNVVGIGDSSSLSAGVRLHVNKNDLTTYGTDGTTIQNDVPVKIQNINTSVNNIMSGIHIRSGTWDGGIIGVPTSNGVNNQGFLALIAETEEGARFYSSGGEGGTVINEHGVDRDFRVESDTNDYMFFVDAGANFVGVGGNRNTTSARLNVNANETAVYDPNTVDTGGGLSIYKHTSTQTNNDSVGVAFRITTDNASTNALGAIRYVQPAYNTFAGQMVFQTRKSNGTYYEQLRLDSEAGALFNSQGDNFFDFTINSDSYTPFFKLDAGANKLRVGSYQNDDGNTMTVGLSGSQTYVTNATEGQLAISTVNNVNGNNQHAGLFFRVSSNNGSNNANASIGLKQPSYTSHNGQIYFNLRSQSQNNFRQYALIDSENGFIVNDGGESYIDFRVESDSNANAFVVNAGTGRVGVNNGNPTYTFEVGAGSQENMGIGWARLEYFTVGIPSSGTRWYKLANYSTGIMLQGQLFMSSARNGGANQTNGARMQHGSLAGYNNSVNSGDWGDVGTNYGHTAYYIEVGTDTHVYLRVNGSVYTGEVYCQFQGRANWVFDGSYVTSAP
ncbi:tail fiber domain-containing protein [Roseobacter phage CRP-902]|nr:tail fiber domain-containing protein [Roseobacter phage CRP-902]